LVKVQRVTQKTAFTGALQGKLLMMAIEGKIVLDVPDGFDEKDKINHANCLKIDHANEFISLLEFCQSKQRIN
jgi:hypothetical protein